MRDVVRVANVLPASVVPAVQSPPARSGDPRSYAAARGASALRTPALGRRTRASSSHGRGINLKRTWLKKIYSVLGHNSVNIHF
jgi:hypothetical protein